MQRLTISGRLGKDLELQESRKNGDKLVYCPFSIATEGFYNKEKNERETLWLDFVTYGDLAERMAGHLRKGDVVEVVFQIVRSAVEVQGRNIQTYKLRVLEVNFLWVRTWHEKTGKEDKNGNHRQR